MRTSLNSSGISIVGPRNVIIIRAPASIDDGHRHDGRTSPVSGGGRRAGTGLRVRAGTYRSPSGRFDRTFIHSSPSVPFCEPRVSKNDRMYPTNNGAVLTPVRRNPISPGYAYAVMSLEQYSYQPR